MKYLLFITLLFFSLTMGAQTKYEKEIRLDKEEVPTAALDYIASFSFGKKVKWYKEFSLDHTSVEAKTKHQGRRYSIEFSDDGTLEDVEIRIKEDEIPPKVGTRIKDHLGLKFKKHKIRKVQLQYVGPAQDVRSFLLGTEEPQGIETNYELIVSARVDKAYKSFEFLFNEKGEFVHMAEIVQKNTDNIEF